MPTVHLVNRQRAVALPFAGALRAFARAVLADCLAYPGKGSAPLPGLLEIGVALVSDAVSAGLHERFMGVPGPTDVITFQHGEMAIGVAVAARQARAHRQSLERELRRLIIHGLLHLNGHEDDRPETAAVMWRAQETILRRRRAELKRGARRR